MRPIDLNCDLGEGAGHDKELMSLITSANIACGAHAGDAETMRTTVMLAKTFGVAIGAHPGYVDRENFGRRELTLTAQEVFALVSAQILALKAITEEVGVRLVHVKPHGALYNVAARDAHIATAIVDAVCVVDNRLVFFGLAGSELIGAGRRAGLCVANEVFADRAYRSDGSLVPRSQPDAVLVNEKAMIAQVLGMVTRGIVKANDGTEIAVQADSLCLHGDGPPAVNFAKRIRQALAEAGVPVKSFSL
jgi:UPF0271 protein